MAFLQGYKEQIFEALLDFILGDQVFGYACETAEGLRRQCSWAQLLAFEFQLRRRAFKAIDEGSTFADSIHVAMRCERTRRQHFETPMTMAAGAAMASRGRSSRPDMASSSHIPPVKKNDKAGARPKGKAKAKAKGRSRGPAVDNGGDRICFRFQKSKCNIAGCQFKHACQRCGATDHGAVNCPQKSA